MADTYWQDRRGAVTGGASFIGSHLVDKLVEQGADITVIDDFSSGTLENLSQSRGKVNIVRLDLLRRTIHRYTKTHARKGCVDEKLLMERSIQ